METDRQASRYTIVEELWEPSPEAVTGIPRRARHSVRVQAYVPAPLSSLDLRLDAPSVQAVADAQEAVVEAQRYAQSVGVSTIAQQLLRSEAIASSQIEGIAAPSHRALAKALAGNQHRPGARAVLANLEAVRWVYEWAGGSSDPLSSEVIREIHARLSVADTFLQQQAGAFRTAQNWIGHDPHTPADADFVPPPARYVEELMDDLAEYANRTDVAPLVQAAMVHAQFETIHPFADGNGRVGRSLIGAILSRRAICRDVIPPISLVLARERGAYVDALTAWRFEDHGFGRLVALLASATEEAALASTRLAGQVIALQERWRDMAGHPRRDSAAAAIIDALPGQPILSAEQAAALSTRSAVAARNALSRLEAAGVVSQVTVGKRNRMWESAGLFALVDEMERELSAGRRGAASTR